MPRKKPRPAAKKAATIARKPQPRRADAVRFPERQSLPRAARMGVMGLMAALPRPKD